MHKCIANNLVTVQLDIMNESLIIKKNNVIVLIRATNNVFEDVACLSLLLHVNANVND